MDGLFNAHGNEKHRRIERNESMAAAIIYHLNFIMERNKRNRAN